MRCALVLYAAALVGLSTGGWYYRVGGYSGQQMPVSYYLPVPSNMYTGHQQMYVPGQQQMYVPGHQHMYVPQYHQPQVAAAYPVRQTPAHQVRPMVVSPQVQQFSMSNQNMEAESSCSFLIKAMMYLGTIINDVNNHPDTCEAYKLRTENFMRVISYMYKAQGVSEADNSCRHSMRAIIIVSNSVLNYGNNHADFCEAYKQRTENSMKAVTNICQSYIVPDCRDFMDAILYITNFVRGDDALYSCEVYKPRTDNFMMAVINICLSYLNSSALHTSCRSSMIQIHDVSYDVRKENYSDSCEAYKLRIDDFMKDIQNLAKI